MEEKRYGIFSGDYLGSRYYDQYNNLTQTSHDVYGVFGSYLYTEHYDTRTGETFKSYEGPHD